MGRAFDCDMCLNTFAGHPKSVLSLNSDLAESVEEELDFCDECTKKILNYKDLTEHETRPLHPHSKWSFFK